MVEHINDKDLERLVLIVGIVFFIIAVGFAGFTWYHNNYVYEAPVSFNFTLEEYNNKNNNSVWVEVDINTTPLILPLPSPLPY